MAAGVVLAKENNLPTKSLKEASKSQVLSNEFEVKKKELVKVQKAGDDAKALKMKMDKSLKEEEKVDPYEKRESKENEKLLNACISLKENNDESEEHYVTSDGVTLEVETEESADIKNMVIIY